MHGKNGTDLTLAEAASPGLLNPAMSEKQLQTIIRALEWPAAGQRRVNRVGHPHATYRWADICALHEALTPFMRIDEKP
jgi:hypothetical protein